MSDKMKTGIITGKEFYLGDFGYFSMSVYNEISSSVINDTSVKNLLTILGIGIYPSVAIMPEIDHIQYAVKWHRIH